MFDEDFVSLQLTSSGAMAYFELMQIGFPLKVGISELMEHMRTFLEPRHISIGTNVCCYILCSAVGLNANEFKLGKTDIFIRPGKTHLLDVLYDQLKYSKAELKRKFHDKFLDFMRKVILKRLQFLGKRKFSYFNLFLYSNLISIQQQLLIIVFSIWCQKTRRNAIANATKLCTEC